jgi:hypothetical protein
VNITLSDPTGGAVLGTPSSAVLTLQNGATSLASQLQFSVATVDVPRTAGSAVFTVVRTGGLSGTDTVQFATSDGTAVAGTDYMAESGTLTFSPDATTESITIPILDNTQAQGSKTVNIALSDAAGGATLNMPSSAVLSIDNPQPQQPMPTSLTAVASFLTHSAEAFSIFVTNAYSLYLKRLPDQQGLGYWVNLMQNNGLTDEELEANFLSSAEYIADHGGTGTAWISGMYQDLLGRNPDPGGLAYWTNVLGTGGLPYTVAIGFAASSEREGQRIAADYETYLGRPLDPDGQAYWVNQFLNGAQNEDVVAGFIGSAEYYDNPEKGQTNDTAWVDDLAYWLTPLI